MIWHSRSGRGWIRLWRYGPGISWKPVANGLLFSQRHGIRRYVRLFGRYWTFIPNGWGRM